MEENKRVDIKTGFLCNNNCKFCVQAHKKKYGNRTTQEIKNDLKESRKTCSQVVFTGGEVTIRDDIVELVSYAKSLDFKRIQIQTNARMLCHKDFCEKMIKAGANEFSPALHGHISELHDYLTQAKGSFKQTVQAIKNLKELNQYVITNTVITKSNYRFLPNIAKLLVKLGVNQFQFAFPHAIGNAEKNFDQIVPLVSLTAPFIHKGLQIGIDAGIKVMAEAMPYCVMKGYENCISENYIPQGEIRDINTFDPDWENTRKSYGKTKFSQCKECTYDPVCEGPWKEYPQRRGNHEFQPITNSSSDKKQENSFKEQTIKDLNLFKKALKKKPNNNNVYDTYSFFLTEDAGIKDEDFIYDSWKKQLQKIKQKKAPDLLSLYIHIPFCESNCDYCCYPSTTLKTGKELDTFLEHLFKKMKKFSPLFENFEFKTLNIGGGTPSIFSEEKFSSLIKEIFSKFKFHKYSEKAIELNPKTTTFEKLKILEEYGFNKISIGVQSLSQRVLKINNRSYQTKEMIKNVIDNFNKFDLNYLNVDLLLGLKGDTVEDFVNSFEEVCKIGPSNICIYPVKTNNKYIQQNYVDFKNFTNFYYPLFDEVSKKIISIGKKYGFINRYNPDNLSYIAPLVFSRQTNKKIQRIDYQYTHFNLPPYSNFCLGYYSHSRIADFIDYLFVDKNNKDSMFLKDFSANPDDFIYIIQKLSPRFERVKFIIKKFYLNWRIPRKEYKEFYGTDILEDFSYAIKALKHFGIIKVTPEEIIFKKIDEKDIYPYLLFFAGRRNVLKTIKKFS